MPAEWEKQIDTIVKAIQDTGRPFLPVEHKGIFHIMSQAKGEETTDYIPDVIDALSSAGVSLSPEELSIFWTYLAANTWYSVILRGGEGSPEKLARADRTVRKMINEFNLNPSEMLNTASMSGRFDKPEFLLITPLSFTEMSVWAREKRMVSASDYADWLLKYIPAETAKPVFASMASNGVRSQDWLRRMYDKKHGAAMRYYQFGRGNPLGLDWKTLPEWLDFINFTLSRSALPLFDGPAGDSLFASLIPPLFLWYEDWAATEPAVTGNSLVKPTTHNVLGQTKSEAANILAAYMLSWMEKSSEENSLFKGCGELGLFTRRNPVGADVSKAYHAIKKLPEVFVQMNAEWKKLCLHIADVWGMNGEYIPWGKDEWSAEHKAMYERVADFLCRAWVVNASAARKYMDSVPFLRNRTFLFGGDNAGKSFPSIPVGVRLMAAGIKFDDTASESPIPEKEMYARIMMSDGANRISAADLSRPMNMHARSVCHDLCLYLSEWNHSDMRKSHSSASKNTMVLPGVKKWMAMNLNERDNIKTAGEFYCLCAAEKAKNGDGMDEAVSILARKELWADGMRKLLNLPPLYEGQHAISRDCFFLSGLFNVLLTGVERGWTESVRNSIIRLAITYGEYEELLLKDERERYLESASYSPGDTDGPWHDAYETLISKVLCFRDDGIPHEDKRTLTLGVRNSAVFMSDLRASFPVYSRPPVWKGNVTLPYGAEHPYPGIEHNMMCVLGKNTHALLGNNIYDAPEGDTRGFDSLCWKSMSEYTMLNTWSNNPSFWEELEKRLAGPSNQEMSPAASYAYFRAVFNTYTGGCPLNVPMDSLSIPLDFGVAYRAKGTLPCYLNERYKTPVALVSKMNEEEFASMLHDNGKWNEESFVVSFLLNKPLPAWFFLEMSECSPITEEHALMKADEVVKAWNEGVVSTKAIYLGNREQDGLPLPPNPVWMDLFADRVYERMNVKELVSSNYPQVESAPLFVNEQLVMFLADRCSLKSYVTENGESAGKEDARRWGRAACIRTMFPDRTPLLRMNTHEQNAFIESGINGLRNIGDTVSKHVGFQDEAAVNVAQAAISFIAGFDEMMRNILEKYPLESKKQDFEKMREMMCSISASCVYIIKEQSGQEGPEDTFVMF